MTDTPILDLEPDEGDLLADALAGLSRPIGRKSLPCKWFYDAAGSDLFDRITELPEYYQTRTEADILRRCAPALAERFGGATLVEYGSGSSAKTRILLDALRPSRYVPIDISRHYLANSAAALRSEYPGLDVRPVLADYGRPIRLPEGTSPNRLGFFPGGTLGNFRPAAAVAFLKRVADTLGRGSGLVVGVDLKKDPARLHAAYNDDAGVTAAFNLNLLARLNREAGADFDPDAWHHYAFYEPRRGRIEMHLVSARDQSASVGDRAFAFKRGESIQTENSYKFTVAGLADLAARAGFDAEADWTDGEDLFAVVLLRAQR